MSRGWLVGLVAVTGLVGASPLRAQRALNPERDAVVRIVEAVAQQIQAGNLAGVDTLYAPRGLHIIDGNNVSHGWAEYRDTQLKPRIEQMRNLQLRNYGVEAVVRESVAWASFRYDLSGHAASGAVATEGRGTAILEKRDGRVAHRTHAHRGAAEGRFGWRDALAVRHNSSFNAHVKIRKGLSRTENPGNRRGAKPLREEGGLTGTCVSQQDASPCAAWTCATW